MRNISWHHNLLANSGMACVEIWYSDAGATMDDIRFEQNMCANIGDGGWSAGSRPDPAGRSVCSYDNTAKTTAVSVVNNIFWESQAFEGMLYLSNTWETWASKALTFSNNVLYRTPTLPPSPQHGSRSRTLPDDLIRLIGDHQNFVASNFSIFSDERGGAGAHTILTDPWLNGLANAPVTLTIDELTLARPLQGSPVLRAGAFVRWRADFDGQPLPAAPERPTIGPFQGTVRS
jgi:hypothetical protein